MAYDEALADRILARLVGQPDLQQKKMFGGIAFMVRGNMCLGVIDDSVMARVGAEQHQMMLERDHVREMDFTGRPMKGYVFVDAEGVDADTDE